MAQLAREGSHSYAVRSVATRIVHDVPSKQVGGELATLYRWVRDNIRYRFDPVDLEWVQSPARTLTERAGDCDDMAVLLAALAGSLGHKYRFLTVGPSKGIMKHVAVEAWDGRQWVTLDPVLEPPGKSTAPRSDLGKFGQRAPHRASHLWDDGGAMLSGTRCHMFPRSKIASIADSRRRVRDLRRCGYDVTIVHKGRGRVVMKSRRKHRGRGSITHTHLSGEDHMLHGQVGPEGIALWESQLGAATLVHVEPPAIAARMRGALRRVGASPRGGRPARVSPAVAAKLRRKACQCHAATRGLSGAVSPEQTELWSWNAYYPSDPNRIPLAAPIPSAPYRSSDAPGFANARPLVISAPAGTLSGGLGYIGNLGFGFLKKIGKAVGGVVKGAANIVTKIPGVNIAAKLIPGASLALDAAKMVGGILSPDKKPSGGGAPPPVEASAPQALTAAAPGGAAPSPYAPPGAGPAAAPVRIPTNIAQRGDIDALRQEVRANAGFATKADVAALKDALNQKQSAKQAAAQKAAVAKAVKACQKQAKAATKAAVKKQHTKDAAKAKKAALKAQKRLAKAAAQLKKLRARPCPELGQKYPAGARQRFDPKQNKYVVYAPKKASGAVSGLAGFQDASALGVFKPTLTFTLSGLGAATAQQAQAAIAAVQAFAAKNKQPPQIPIAPVAAFQKADGGLKPDGLWGPNARAAAAFYTGRPVSQLPDVAKPYAKTKITWKPPASQVATSQPAIVKPAPKASKPAKPAKVKASKPAPVVVVAAPSPKQQAAAVYGPDAIAKPSLLPVTGGALAPIPPIPPIAEIAPVSQGGRGAPPLPIDGGPAPAPLPPAPSGMKIVGTEDSNPGLPPVDASSSASTPRITIDVSGPKIARKKKRKSGAPPPAFPAPPLHPGGPRSVPFDDDDSGVPHWLWVLGALWMLDTKPGRRRVA